MSYLWFRLCCVDSMVISFEIIPPRQFVQCSFSFLIGCPLLVPFYDILRGFRSATISAVKAATKRSMQLGGVSEDDITNKYNL